MDLLVLCPSGKRLCHCRGSQDGAGRRSRVPAQIFWDPVGMTKKKSTSELFPLDKQLFVICDALGRDEADEGGKHERPKMTCMTQTFVYEYIHLVSEECQQRIAWLGP